MICGIFLRNFKTYHGINYIPLTDEVGFCGLLGNNGVGKSSVLEALDSFFNDKAWTYNTVVKKSGIASTAPHIVPVFAFRREDLDKEFELYSKGNSDLYNKLKVSAEILNSTGLGISEDDASNSKTKNLIREFIAHRERLNLKLGLSEYYLISLGMDYLKNISISIIDNLKLTAIAKNIDPNVTDAVLDVSSYFSILHDFIIKKIEYIYIPKEINPDEFTRLETNEIQTLMGEKLHDIIEGKIGPNLIGEINKGLNSFLDTISSDLGDYSYRTPTNRQQNLKKGDIYNLIVESFFKIRKLHKRQDENTWLEINSLSSGEKQRAVINVAYNLLCNHRAEGDNLIIAIDEPESSLHMSACFEQFNAIYEISNHCMQVIFASHWYGFLPTIESGCISVISKNDNGNVFDLINLSSYREEIKQLTKESRGKLPFDIRLKSMNDFIQSIMTSCTGDTPYNWLICEGTSEKIYLSSYLDELIKKHNLRIIPVGGAREIKNIYLQLSSCYKDFESDITGTIYLLSDTDSEMVSYDVEKFKKLHCKRIVQDQIKNEAKLVYIHENPVSPATEIEDVLNAALFYKTLISFREEYENDLSFILDEDCPDAMLESRYALNLRPNDRVKLDNFFNIDGMKFRFSKKYIEKMEEEEQEFNTPSWIDEIKNVFLLKNHKK